jgi:hypothetical protein
MNSGELTSDQIKALQDHLKPSFLFLKRLADRFAERGFNPEDEIYKAVREAFDKVHSLNVKLHYLGCDASKREREAERKAKGKPFSPWGT